MNSYADDYYCHNHRDLGCGHDLCRVHVGQGVDNSTIGHEMMERTSIIGLFVMRSRVVIPFVHSFVGCGVRFHDEERCNHSMPLL